MNYTAPDLEGAMMDHDDTGFDDAGESCEDYGFNADDLIDEPNKVAKIQINFDRVARQLDVKKLKECMWGQLSLDEPEPDAGHKFSEIVSEVPKVIPADMSSNVSVPYCFICLLYTSDAADEEDSVDLGGRRIIKKKKKKV
eukprot:TRINITY_DN40708_c0_g1_i2.p1 TRINITY_DN40708_c0_g1~~TRINITY_DN40708_c0_g1_i2.p1  ORF type:complete len:141 (-),score=48.94 TRINITY_DN40708_c0_g1_i2:41-463(-)